MKIEKSKIEEFKKCLSDGLKNIETACEIYVSEIDANQENKKYFISECPEIPPSAWANFEMVGRKAMDYRLLWGGGRANSALKRLPKSLQSEILDNGVVVPSGSSKRIVPVTNLTNSDIKIVFNGRSVRTLEEQVAFIERNKTSAARQRPAYYIDGKDLVVTCYQRIPLITLRKLVK